MRVVIADDELLLREGLARLLAEVGFDVVGKAADPVELARTVDLTRPDIVIVDIRMPPTHTDEGLVAARELGRTHPEVGVLVLRTTWIRGSPGDCSRNTPSEWDISSRNGSRISPSSRMPSTGSRMGSAYRCDDRLAPASAPP